MPHYLPKKEFLEKAREYLLPVYEAYFAECEPDMSKTEGELRINRYLERDLRMLSNIYPLKTSHNLFCQAVALLLCGYDFLSKLSMQYKWDLTIFMKDLGRETTNIVCASILREKGVKRLEDLVTFSK